MEIENKNYYEILEIPFNCTQEEIHQAFNRAKNAYQGDSAALYSLLTEDEIKRIVDAIDEAYTILGNPEKRMQYDKARGFDKERGSEDKIKIQNMAERFSGASNSVEAEISHERNLEKAQRDLQKKSEFTYDNKPKTDVTRAEAYSKFALDFKKDEAFEQEIENCTEFTGEFLKKIREYKNVDLKRMADMTKVSKTHITNIEEENLDRLPANAYIRGFVFQYAKCLKLNTDLVCKSYLARIDFLKNPPVEDGTK
jgi:curved DNA-binding protein CbpA